MTKEEELISELVRHKQEVQNDFGWNTTLQTALDAAISALKAQPCENAVSREAVLDALHVEGRPTKRFDYVIDVKRDIMALPPVAPKPKTGKWIKEESIYGWDGKSYQCSVCGRSIHLDTKAEDLRDYPYCHCGAKMEGESDET